jgi:predicted nucleic-acid-binding Zn-ribbon protein
MVRCGNTEFTSQSISKMAAKFVKFQDLPHLALTVHVRSK